jgi:hypothetical protein
MPCDFLKAGCGPAMLGPDDGNGKKAYENSIPGGAT